MRTAQWALTGWLIVCAGSAVAQSTPPQASSKDWLGEINRDVWTPFMDGVRKDDASLYLNVRSSDYVRVQASAKLILTHADYVDDTVQMMGRYREQGTRISIDVRFEERIVDGQSASEKGISRAVFSTRDGGTRTYYSRFHTISRKEDGRWRVLTDYFPDADPALGEAQFQVAKPLEDFSGFQCYMKYPDKKQRCD